MDDLIAQFLDFTGSSDPAVARQYLDATANDVEYAVTLFMEANPPQASAPAASDEQLAQTLQHEAYGDPVRDADASVHRHETLVDADFAMRPPVRPTDIFGQGRGIFNQRFDEDETMFYESNRLAEVSDDDEEEVYDDENAYDDDEIIDLDSDEEAHRPRSRRRVARSSRLPELTSTQRRLANLFRPPFDIMEKVDLDAAKTLGRQQQKWILINVQDSSEFQCQMLNRDFWSKPQIKQKVRECFVFLQYQHDSPNGSEYRNFYWIDKFPHIAILDPLTGERVHKFAEGEVPNPDDWIEEVDSFLSRFSLHPSSTNPIVHHEPKVDPDAMTEEQQIEYALKQSVVNNGGSEQKPIVIEDDDIQPAEEADPFVKIEPVDHDVSDESPSTRIQVRFPNGKRLVHKFRLNDTVLQVYEWLKFAVSNDDYGITPQDRFNLSNTSNRAIKLIDSLDMSVEQAGLKNASILLEKE